MKASRTRLRRTSPCLLVSLLLSFSTTVLAQKTDVVILINGNAVTGEIKSLEFGTLRYSTDSMGTVNIDWEDVVKVTSNQALQIEVTDGRRYFGSLQAAEERFTINVVGEDLSRVLTSNDVVRITPIETQEKIWQRLEGSVSLGLNTQKASDVTTFNAAAQVSYRTLQYLAGINLSSNITDQSNEEASARHRAALNFQRFRANRWFTEFFTSWEKNDELGINARVSAGAALGRYFVQTNKDQFSFSGGVVATRESFTGTEDSTTQGEGKLQVRYQHRNLKPEGYMSLTSEVYPLLEDPSVFRAETDLTFRRELIADLDFDISVYHSYQSETTDDAASSDYGVVTSLAYSF